VASTEGLPGSEALAVKGMAPAPRDSGAAAAGAAGAAGAGESRSRSCHAWLMRRRDHTRMRRIFDDI